MKRVLLLMAAVVSTADTCGQTCPPVKVVQPMSELRAHQIDPSVATGVAFSMTHVFGDCRKDRARPTTDACGRSFDAACAKDRAALRLFIVPVNMSITMSPDCPGAFGVSDLGKTALVDARASEDGEIVQAVAAGRYVVLVSSDDRCAACGLTDGGAGCLVDVVQGELTVRDLVLDESAH